MRTEYPYIRNIRQTLPETNQKNQMEKVNFGSEMEITYLYFPLKCGITLPYSLGAFGSCQFPSISLK